ncbi:hypothetical protein ElyMa_000297300 [Elysia marginata]|uniref:Uncharacterized protein n=1 Tax=Elysia marginata TaxID=1093978 RepID=A0AAV4F945_9GAST|nr:hypothetical protein ElyMa_000297300 [Elysia marginata]
MGNPRTPYYVAQSLIITLLKKSNLKQSQNCKTISLIGHVGKGMLRVILNRLPTQAEEIIAEEQAGIGVEGAHRANIQLIKNIANINIFSRLIDSKKAIDAPWPTIKYNVRQN